MEINKLEAMNVERNTHGEWTHPVYAEYYEKHFSDGVTQEKWDAMLGHFGIKVAVTNLADDVPAMIAEQMVDDCDLSNWDPITPQGFFLIDIYFGEDGAVAIFAKGVK